MDTDERPTMADTHDDDLAPRCTCGPRASDPEHGCTCGYEDWVSER